LNLQGGPCLEAAYHGETTLLQSFWRIAGLRGLVVEVRFLEGLQNDGQHRRDLAKQAEAAIRFSLGLAAKEKSQAA
jgi:hypothetical protein